MKQQSFFESADGKSVIYWTLWTPDDKPVVEVLQITHGMCEYMDRYEGLALYLNQYGIAVAGADQLGHGKTGEGSHGYFGEQDGWKLLAEDVERLHQQIKQEFPGVPVTVMGHSMGSFVVRVWMAKYGREASKLILMGTAGKNPACGAGIRLVRQLRKKRGGTGRSRLVTAMAFGSYNKKIKPVRTTHDWLTRDEAVVDAYLKDPYCTFEFTLAAYEDLFRMLQYVNTEQWFKKVPKDRRILMLSGWEDPVGNYGKGPIQVYEGLKKEGCDVGLLLYEGMRHEVLNEIGKEAVYKEIKEFILG
ncbi:MAG: lysophospholipase [Firmicutes bacterium]|nr:lysophospholipase [Bacillota bacterium]